jgi:hypothetical protein
VTVTLVVLGDVLQRLSPGIEALAYLAPVVAARVINPAS